MRLLASDAARVLGAPMFGADVESIACGFDSRSTRPDEMFVAIVGDRDGHDYAHDAVLMGANSVLVQRRIEGLDATQIVVDDTVAALGRLAAWRRDQIGPQVDSRVVGITGSVGKTSTKDMIIAAMSKVETCQPVVASAKSLNNDIGLPVTILNAVPDVRTLVLEMGMRGFGEIERLCSVARPTIGVVTAVGDAHSERVGGIEGVARAKSELVRALPSDGTAVLNYDDMRVRAMADMTSARVMSYGQSTDADVSFEVFSMASMFATIILEHRGRSARLTLPWPGIHMASNAAAACAVALTCGATLEETVEGLESLGPDDGRMKVRRGAHGITVVDDSYNANPTSVAAALETVSLSGSRRKIAVLGIMAEVADAELAHRRIAQLAVSKGIEVVAVDTSLYGVAPVTREQAVDIVSHAEADTIVLVKGSRIAGLESVVDQIVTK